MAAAVETRHRGPTAKAVVAVMETYLDARMYFVNRVGELAASHQVRKLLMGRRHVPCASYCTVE